MKSSKKYVIGLLTLVVILSVAFFTRDWYVFYKCGAVETCLAESSYFQHYSKFAVTTIMTIVAFFVGKKCICPRDRKLLLLASVLALCADFCLKILHNAVKLFDHSSDYTLLGICFFMVFQAVLIYRHTRKSDKDNSVPWIICVPFAVMFLTNALHLFDVFESAMIPIVATYGAFLICSVIVAVKAPKVGYFPASNAKLIKRGMILFFCCDACVGLSLATGPDHSTQEIVATIANNFVWYFYVPALICLVMSGLRRK